MPSVAVQVSALDIIHRVRAQPDLRHSRALLQHRAPAPLRRHLYDQEGGPYDYQCVDLRCGDE